MDVATHDIQPRQDEGSGLPGRYALVTCGEFPFVLPLPIEEDDLETTARKACSLADAIRDGCRITLTSEVASFRRKHNAEAFAKERMSVAELAQYEEWKEQRACLPEFDWLVNQTPVPSNAEKTFSQRAAAIDLIWQRQGTTPENAAWLTANIPTILPLVKAVTKLLTAQIHLEKNDQLAQLGESEIAEIEALRHITAAIDRNLAREREKLRQLAERSKDAMAIVQGRLNSLRK